MSNWHNEVFENEDLYLIPHEEDYFEPYVTSHREPENKRVEYKESSGTGCKYCGTRTGIHGFSFNREGRY